MPAHATETTTASATNARNLRNVRENARAREHFLNDLLRNNHVRIYRTLAATVKPGHQLFKDLLDGDLQQAFLWGAHVALDKAFEDDDGRGKNDFRAFCAWSGMNAVKSRIRESLRKMRLHSAEYPIGSFAELSSEQDEFCARDEYAQRLAERAAASDEPANIVVETETINAFFAQLSGSDRLVAELLHMGYGPQQRNAVPGERRGPRENYLHSLSEQTGLSQTRLLAALRRLRSAAEQHFGPR